MLQFTLLGTTIANAPTTSGDPGTAGASEPSGQVLADFANALGAAEPAAAGSPLDAGFSPDPDLLPLPPFRQGGASLFLDLAIPGPTIAAPQTDVATAVPHEIRPPEIGALHAALAHDRRAQGVAEGSAPLVSNATAWALPWTVILQGDAAIVPRLAGREVDNPVPELSQPGFTIMDTSDDQARIAHPATHPQEPDAPIAAQVEESGAPTSPDLQALLIASTAPLPLPLAPKPSRHGTSLPSPSASEVAVNRIELGKQPAETIGQPFTPQAWVHAEPKIAALPLSDDRLAAKAVVPDLLDGRSSVWQGPATTKQGHIQDWNERPATTAAIPADGDELPDPLSTAMHGAARRTDGLPPDPTSLIGRVTDSLDHPDQPPLPSDQPRRISIADDGFTANSAIQAVGAPGTDGHSGRITPMPSRTPPAANVGFAGEGAWATLVSKEDPILEAGVPHLLATRVEVAPTRHAEPPPVGSRPLANAWRNIRPTAQRTSEKVLPSAPQVENLVSPKTRPGPNDNPAKGHTAGAAKPPRMQGFFWVGDRRPGQSEFAPAHRERSLPDAPGLEHPKGLSAPVTLIQTVPVPDGTTSPADAPATPVVPGALAARSAGSGDEGTFARPLIAGPVAGSSQELADDATSILIAAQTVSAKPDHEAGEMAPVDARPERTNLHRKPSPEVGLDRRDHEPNGLAEADRPDDRLMPERKSPFADPLFSPGPASGAGDEVGGPAPQRPLRAPDPDFVAFQGGRRRLGAAQDFLSHSGKQTDRGAHWAPIEFPSAPLMTKTDGHSAPKWPADAGDLQPTTAWPNTAAPHVPDFRPLVWPFEAAGPRTLAVDAPSYPDTAERHQSPMTVATIGTQPPRPTVQPLGGSESGPFLPSTAEPVRHRPIPVNGLEPSPFAPVPALANRARDVPSDRLVGVNNRAPGQETIVDAPSFERSAPTRPGALPEVLPTSSQWPTSPGSLPLRHVPLGPRTTSSLPVKAATLADSALPNRPLPQVEGAALKQPALSSATNLQTSDERVGRSDPASGRERRTSVTPGQRMRASVRKEHDPAFEHAESVGAVISLAESAPPRPMEREAHPQQAHLAQLAPVREGAINSPPARTRPFGGFEAAALPRQLPATLIEGARRSKTEDRVELWLDPVELGRVRFELSPVGDRLQVTVSVERPETLDLLRRNAELLRTEFREAGFDAANLSFGQWGGGGERQPGLAPPHSPDATFHAPNPTEITPALTTPTSAPISGGLDLRL
jgi:Flagellar hook-length control protein FliK